jgi:SAM-dependent methyltransferase
MTAQRPLLDVEEIWRRYDRMEARLTAPLSERMLDLAGVGPGMRVLDLATGRGEPAIAAAHRVGPSGSVLGVDVSASMLEMARQRAAHEGVMNLELRVMSATSLDAIPATSFDSTLVRWGLMYMDAPIDALVGARRALVPGGVLVAAVWAVPDRVPYFTLPRRVLEKYRALPPIDPDTPGTFYYADSNRLPRDLERAGFEVEHVEELDIPVMEAENASELIAWVRTFGLTRLLNDLPEQVQRSWEEELARQTEPLRKDGFVRLGGVTRIVVASRADSIDPT